MEICKEIIDNHKTSTISKKKNKIFLSFNNRTTHRSKKVVSMCIFEIFEYNNEKEKN